MKPAESSEPLNCEDIYSLSWLFINAMQEAKPLVQDTGHVVEVCLGY